MDVKRIDFLVGLAIRLTLTIALMFLIDLPKDLGAAVIVIVAMTYEGPRRI